MAPISDSRTHRQLGDPFNTISVWVIHPIDGAIMHNLCPVAHYFATGAFTSAGSAAFAILTRAEKVSASETAISASIRRSNSISARSEERRVGKETRPQRE